MFLLSLLSDRSDTGDMSSVGLVNTLMGEPVFGVRELRMVLGVAVLASLSSEELEEEEGVSSLSEELEASL